MTITETKEAIEKLSDDIGLPMEKAKVTRLDVAANLDLSQRPEMYFPFLGNCQYYTRGAFGHSVLWSNKARAKTFYNKIQEATDKKKIIPDRWKDKNVGRFEIRYLNSRSIKYHLGKSVLGKDLYNETLIIRLPEKMTTEYKAIGKRKEATGDYIHARTPKEIDDLFIREWIMKIGLDEAIQRIENSNLCPRGKRRAKERYRRLIQATGTDYPDLLHELDEKVQEAAKSLIAV